MRRWLQLETGNRTDIDPGACSVYTRSTHGWPIRRSPRRNREGGTMLRATLRQKRCCSAGMREYGQEAEYA
eukprot:1187523-Prorocentrum_minimum.AAC.3